MDEPMVITKPSFLLMSEHDDDPANSDHCFGFILGLPIEKIRAATSFDAPQTPFMVALEDFRADIEMEHCVLDTLEDDNLLPIAYQTDVSIEKTYEIVKLWHGFFTKYGWNPGPIMPLMYSHEV